MLSPSLLRPRGRCEETPWPEKVGTVVLVAFPHWTLLPKGLAGSSPGSSPRAWAHQACPPRAIEYVQTKIQGQDCSGIFYPQRLLKFRAKPRYLPILQIYHGHPNQHQSANIISKVCSSTHVVYCPVSHDQAKEVLL